MSPLCSPAILDSCRIHFVLRCTSHYKHLSGRCPCTIQLHPLRTLCWFYSLSRNNHFQFPTCTSFAPSS